MGWVAAGEGGGGGLGGRDDICEKKYRFWRGERENGGEREADDDLLMMDDTLVGVHVNIIIFQG